MRSTAIKFSGILMMALLLTSCGESVESKVADEANKVMDDASKKGASSTKMEKMEVKVNLADSKVKWAGTMVGVYSHDGDVKITKANLVMANGKVASGDFTVDLSTINPTDKNYMDQDGKRVEDLVGHLSSEDFFDTAKYPTANFVITAVNGDKAKGKLTVRGVTNEETIEGITIKKSGGVVKIGGTLTFDRKKYGVAFDHPMKDMVLKNDVTLNITLVGKI